MKNLFSASIAKSAIRIAALAGLAAAASGCTYDGGVGVGYASGGGYGGYNCDPYSPFDNYYSCDSGYGFSNIGYGGGWYSDYYYPGYGAFIFDTYGRRYPMQGNYQRYWGQRRYDWYRSNNRHGQSQNNGYYDRGNRGDNGRGGNGYADNGRGGQRFDGQQGAAPQRGAGNPRPDLDQGPPRNAAPQPQAAPQNYQRSGRGRLDEGLGRQRANMATPAPDTPQATRQYTPSADRAERGAGFNQQRGGGENSSRGRYGRGRDR